MTSNAKRELTALTVVVLVVALLLSSSRDLEHDRAHVAGVTSPPVKKERLGMQPIVSILGIQLHQSRDELKHLVPEIYSIEKRGPGLEAWHLATSARDEWPYSLRFVDGVLCQITGKGLSINSHAFGRHATKEELVSELPELQDSWSGGLFFETENVELSISVSPIGNDYILEDRHRMKIWSERFLSPENSHYGKKYSTQPPRLNRAYQKPPPP